MNMKDIRTDGTDRLFKAMMALESVVEFYDFFEDLCTVKELRDMTQRFEVAALLDKGMSYQKVSELTNVSSATISRVKRCLYEGLRAGCGKRRAAWIARKSSFYSTMGTVFLWISTAMTLSPFLNSDDDMLMVPVSGVLSA